MVKIIAGTDNTKNEYQHIDNQQHKFLDYWGVVYI